MLRDAISVIHAGGVRVADGFHEGGNETVVGIFVDGIVVVL